MIGIRKTVCFIVCLLLLITSTVTSFVAPQLIGPQENGDSISSKNINNYNSKFESKFNNTNPIEKRDFDLDNIPNLFYFTENKGQIRNKNVRYYDQGGRLWFTNDAIWFKISEMLNSNYDPTNNVIIKKSFIGANDITSRGTERIKCYNNYFYGNESTKWLSDVPNYRSIYYENLYDGIDLKYYILDTELKYDFIVSPGKNPEQIRVKYDGISGISIENGTTIFIETPINRIVDSDLFIYQIRNNEINEINGNFIKYNNFEFGFDITQEYDETIPLIIDPKVTLNYSTYLGGNTMYDFSHAIEVDSKGNSIVAGYTKSPDFPTTIDAYDTTKNLVNDVFITKFNSNGSGLIYSTFIGGSGWDYGMSSDIDQFGNIYMTGYTDSPDFPTTSNAYDKSIGSSYVYDCFVLKINNNGTSLIFSTFIGGTSQDMGYGITIDSEGNSYVTGATAASNYPVTNESFDKTLNGAFDVFVLKLNHNGTNINFSTYLGGTNHDRGKDIAIDSNGDVYVTGYTNSSNFPLTNNSIDKTFNGGLDVIIFKLVKNGSLLNYSMILGTSFDDEGTGIVVNSYGNAIVTGVAFPNFPTTPNAFDPDWNGGTQDSFVLKLNKDGSSFVFSSFIGGSHWDESTDIVIDDYGYIYVVGGTNSPNFPITSDSLMGKRPNTDFFVMKIDPTGSFMLFSTLLGGGQLESATGITLDESENLYVIGHTCSTDFPTTPDAFDDVGGCDLIVVKIHIPPRIVITNVSLKQYDEIVNKIFSGYNSYSFQIEGLITTHKANLSSIQLTLDPTGSNIQIMWNKTIQNNFYKKLDPNNFVSLHSSSSQFIGIHNWIIRFNLTFDWNYPDENMNSIQIIGKTEPYLDPVWYNQSSFYEVENDLIFIGNLSVKRANDNEVKENDIIRGGELLKWTGLKVLYEGMNDIYPPAIEYNVTIWDEDGNLWSDSPYPGKNFTVNTTVPSITNLNGFEYTINLSGIPPVNDKTNVKFEIKIDADNITFSNPYPSNYTWQKISNVNVGITITDFGGGAVNGTSIKKRISYDNGKTWGNWNKMPKLNSSVVVRVEEKIKLNEGKDNLIMWSASDSVGNGPVESNKYRILVDSKNVTFSAPLPSSSYVSMSKNISVGISINDITSGVRASSIEYSISKNSGITWSSWKTITGYKDDQYINVTLNLTLPNGTANRIKWRASDIAGNGPNESMISSININTWLTTLIPRVELKSPLNNSIITSTTTNVTWILKNIGLKDITYDLILDTINPPKAILKSNINNTKYTINKLENGKRYYWTIHPKGKIYNGSCISGIWSFNVDSSALQPTNFRQYPFDDQIVPNLNPKLGWDFDYAGDEKLTFDIFLDTTYPPKKIVEFHPNDYYIPTQSLQDGKKYYWKLLPYAGRIICQESETWSFIVNTQIPIPKVDLISPLNESIINVSKPKLEWKLNYEGTETVYYDIYFGDNYPPDIVIENYPSTNYTLENELEEGKRYYWKVVPKCINLLGIKSEIWILIYDLPYSHNYIFDLSISHNIIEIESGKTEFISVFVTNKGNNIDRVAIEIDEDKVFLGVTFNFNNGNSLVLGRKKTIEFNISISVNKETPPRNIATKISVKSEKAEKIGLNITEVIPIFINIKLPSAQSTPEGSGIENEEVKDYKSGTLYKFIIVLIIIIVFIVLFVILVKLKILPTGFLYKKMQNLDSKKNNGANSQDENLHKQNKGKIIQNDQLNIIDDNVSKLVLTELSGKEKE